jgi:hypothetical protein
VRTLLLMVALALPALLPASLAAGECGAVRTQVSSSFTLGDPVRLNEHGLGGEVLDGLALGIAPALGCEQARVDFASPLPLADVDLHFYAGGQRIATSACATPGGARESCLIPAGTDMIWNVATLGALITYHAEFDGLR